MFFCREVNLLLNTAFCHSLCEPFIEVILDSREIADTICTVHTIVDGNEPHIVLREGDLHEHTGLQIISAQPGLIFDDNCADFTGFNVSHHPLEVRAVEVCTAVTIVHIELAVMEAMIVCVFLQDELLRCNM